MRPLRVAFENKIDSCGLQCVNLWFIPRFVTVEREMKERALTKHFGNKVKFTSAHATQGTFENGRSHIVLQKSK